MNQTESALKKDIRLRREKKVHRQLDQQVGKTVLHWEELVQMVKGVKEIIAAKTGYLTIVQSPAIQVNDTIRNATNTLTFDLTAAAKQVLAIEPKLKSGKVTQNDIPLFYSLASDLHDIGININDITMPVMALLNDELTEQAERNKSAAIPTTTTEAL
jgi:hypothetical protein